MFLWNRFALNLCQKVYNQITSPKFKRFCLSKIRALIRISRWRRKKLSLLVTINDYTKIVVCDLNNNPLKLSWKLSLLWDWCQGERKQVHQWPRRLCEIVTGWRLQVDIALRRAQSFINGVWGGFQHACPLFHGYKMWTLQKPKVGGERNAPPSLLIVVIRWKS